MNNNCLGLWYSDCTQKIQGNSCKVSEPSILHLDRKLSNMFRLSHVFILLLHDLFSTSLLPNKINLNKNTHRHFHPPDPVQSCLISTHNFCAFAYSHSINCQQLLQTGFFLCIRRLLFVEYITF